MELTDATRDALKKAGARGPGRRADRRDRRRRAAGRARRPGAGEIIGIAIAAVVLVITFGSLIAAGLPLLTALIGVGIGISTITALANALDLGTTTSTLAMMIGLAVGIDYALFIVSRYRAELAEGREREEAAGRAVGTAGSAVVFAGLTVVIALVGLAVVNIPMLTKMGLAAAGTVVIAVLIALTLIPALLGFAGGSRVLRAAEAAQGQGRSSAEQAQHGHPLGALRPPPPGRRAAHRRGRPRRDRLPAASLELGLPDDGSQPRQHHPAQGVRPALRRLRPRLQRPADGGRRRRQGRGRPRRSSGIKEPRRRRPPSPRRRLNKAGDTAMITVIPKDRPSSRRRPRTWSTPSGTGTQATRRPASPARPR